MSKYSELIDKLENIENKLYGGTYHQVTIDLVQESIIELQEWNDIKNVHFETEVGSLAYKSSCILEICDTSLVDYKLIEELVTLFHEYV